MDLSVRDVAFGGNSGVFAESPDRIFVIQRGETRLPDPLPPAYGGFAGSIGMNTLREVDARVWQNCIFVVDGNLFGTDNQLGRTQKLVPRADAEPNRLIGEP